MPTWSEKLKSGKSSEKKRLEKSFGGMSEGSFMYISTPQEIDAYVRAIPYGQAVSVVQMRGDLANKNGADFTCPLTTGIFLRIVAEAAFENIDTAGVAGVTPFWRVIEPKSNLAGKLSFGGDFVQRKRSEEGIA
jgi:hypothetical protein